MPFALLAFPHISDLICPAAADDDDDADGGGGGGFFVIFDFANLL